MSDLDTQDNYSNPHCACASRVNDYGMSCNIVSKHSFSYFSRAEGVKTTCNGHETE